MTITSDEFTWMTCIKCGIKYALPSALYNHQRQVGGYHHCPNGHSQGWSADGSENARLRRERDRAVQEQARLAQQVTELDRIADENSRRADRAEKEGRRIKRRANSAVCPCCNRHFANVERHIKTKHPEIATLPPRKLPA